MFIVIILRMLKDMADAGYKLYLKGETNTSNNTVIYFFIPLLNIIYMLKISIEFANNKQFMIDEFNVLGYLEEMSENEKKEYNKNPTGLNAILITLKPYEEIKPVHSITFKNNNTTNEILFNISNDGEDIKIIHANGFIAKLSFDEQKQLIRKTIAKIISNDFSEFLKTGKFKEKTYYKLQINGYTIIYKITSKKW